MQADEKLNEKAHVRSDPETGLRAHDAPHIELDYGGDGLGGDIKLRRHWYQLWCASSRRIPLSCR
jgi:hypothetical protein